MASSRENLDGTPDVLKGACPVWLRGKVGDDFKYLPIQNGWVNYNGPSTHLNRLKSRSR